MKGMKKLRNKQFVFIILTIIITLSGYNSKDIGTIKSEKLITAQLDEIDMIEINFAKKESKEIADKEVIGSLYRNFSGIKMEKLTAEKDEDLIKNKEILYSIIFISKKDIVGSIIIFTTGEIIMFDIETMNENQRTQSYINYNLDSKRLHIFKELEREFYFE